MRSARAGDKGDKSTIVKSSIRSDCHAGPSVGTQMFVETSRITRPKLILLAWVQVEEIKAAKEVGGMSRWRGRELEKTGYKEGRRRKGYKKRGREENKEKRKE